MTGRPIDELLRAATAGDRDAMGDLIARHRRQIEGLVRLRAGRLLGFESASDLVQSACRDVVADFSGFRGDRPEQFRAWLNRIVEHKLLERGRYWEAACRDRDRIEPPSPDAGPIDFDALLHTYDSLCTPSRIASSREQVEAIEAALSSLSAEDQRVILLRRFLDVPFADIARDEGATEQVVRKRLSRALARLVRALERADESA
ncbi:MAG: sigma-70 family RNA polymerase sigma factor [Planctomycetes bacterium]|nr:sigma-70 family RNA polymerase sigma factor [Planctomycetota bacterium]